MDLWQVCGLGRRGRAGRGAAEARARRGELRQHRATRLAGGHCVAVFSRIEDINEEIAAARDEDREPVLHGDVRTRPQRVGIARQHRVYAALREFLNHAWKQRHVIPFNPVYAVELEPEETPETARWSAREAARFLVSSAGDPLGLMFRIVVLRGARRGEAVGFRWSGADLEAGYVTVDRPVLQIGGQVVEGKPKTKAGERKIWLDAGTVALLKAHRRAQLAARLRASTAWQDK
jgi:integrase